MSGYTKLFSTILASTIWQESKDTKIVWITMLAAANKDGVVEAAVPGLAHMAKLTIQETETALAVLMSPDPYSRTPAFEGRRIEKCDGGWQILNHDKYREQMSAAERTEYNRVKQQESRERKKARESNSVKTQSAPVSNVNDSSASQRHTEAKEDSNAKANPSSPRRSAPREYDPGSDAVHSVHYQITQQVGAVFTEVTGEAFAFDNAFLKILATFLKGWRGTSEEWFSHYRDVLTYGQEQYASKSLRECSDPKILCKRWMPSLAEVAKLKSDEQNSLIPKSPRFKTI